MRFRNLIRFAMIALVCLCASALAAGGPLDKLTAQDMGLRGSVQKLVETASNAYADGASSASTYSFTQDGNLVERRFGPAQGKEFVTHWTYRNGRLTKSSSGVDGGELNEATFEYDNAGRLLSVSSNGQTFARYEYDHGTYKKIESNPVFEQRPNTAVGTEPWEGGELALQRASGGKLITTYNEHDQPIEAANVDSSGRTLTRVVRHYDDKGRIISDEMTPVETLSDLPAGLEKMNDAQRASIARFMQQAFTSGNANFKYDGQGRVQEKRVRDMRGDTVTTLEYDEQGNFVLEKTTNTPSQLTSTEFGMDEQGNLHPTSGPATPTASINEVHYQYEYDAQGNWTKKSVFTRSDRDDRLTPSMTIRRTITYF